MSAAASISPADRFGLTLFVTIVFHTTLILGISFNLEEPKKKPPADKTLEIMIVQHPKKAEEPEKVDFLAQTSQSGGGKQQEKIRPKTVDVPSTLTSAPVERNLPVTPPTPAPEKKKPKKVLTKKALAKKKITVEPKKKPSLPKKVKVTVAQLLTSSNQEIIRLTAELDRKTKAYAKRPRKKFITASTQEYKYANYQAAWRRKVERIGNLNYPDDARRRKLYGNLVLQVMIQQDGQVRSVSIRKTSGYKLLDTAAIRIVKLSAPFAPFPAEIREETNIIVITRVWQFLGTNRLFSKQGNL
ncbi:energy transducer TonB [Candidatus Vondammii sp. HM_W22]|uniref:energy transducer TonB n=1 Tax=Candidatus Vondammii sp. HM_W22 TaxID=2687299 RepID=UPI001F12DEB4|nr:energy transducer TonB [Candidatus Vondammii sp. HM_W22]